MVRHNYEKDVFPTTSKELSEEIWWACYNGDCGTIQMMWEIRDVKELDFNHRNGEGLTPFFAACYNGHVEAVDLLLANANMERKKTGQMRIDVQAGNRRGCSPFWAACSQGHLKVVQILSKYLDVHHDQPDDFGITPLEIAEEMGHSKVVEFLQHIQSLSEAALSAKTSVLDKSLLSSHIEFQNSMVSSVGQSIYPPVGDEGSVSTSDELWKMAVSRAHSDPEDFITAATDVRLHREGQQVRAMGSLGEVTRLNDTVAYLTTEEAVGAKPTPAAAGGGGAVVFADKAQIN